jgi:hypothetical protein
MTRANRPRTIIRTANATQLCYFLGHLGQKLENDPKNKTYTPSINFYIVQCKHQKNKQHVIFNTKILKLSCGLGDVRIAPESLTHSEIKNKRALSNLSGHIFKMTKK